MGAYAPRNFALHGRSGSERVQGAAKALLTRPFNRDPVTAPSVFIIPFFKPVRILALFLDRQCCKELDRSRNWGSGHKRYKPPCKLYVLGARNFYRGALFVVIQ